MPIFESVEIAKYIPEYHPTNGCCTDDPSCGGYSNETDCVSNNYEWDPDISWTVEKKAKTINLELVSSFEEGMYMYDDPGGSFGMGDPNPNQTLITMSDSPTSILIDEALSTFRTRMAKLF